MSPRALPVALGLALAGAAGAHAPEAERVLRLQLEPSRLAGAITLQLPPGPAASALLGPPPGALPGERAGQAGERTRGARAALAALQGITIGSGAAPEGSLAPPAAQVAIEEAFAAPTPRGGLRGGATLALPHPGPGGLLRVAVERGLPLRVELLAATGLQLDLLAGLGREIPGGLELRPRPGEPAVVRVRAGVSAPAARSTPR